MFAVMLGLLSCALLWLAAPAGAVVTEVSGTSVGLQPRAMGYTAVNEGDPATFANEAGNVVLHGTNDYAIYWAPENDYHHEWITKINRFFQAMGASSGYLGTIFAATAQYRDRSNAPANYKTVFKGSYSDYSKYPAAGCTDPNPLESGAVTCLTDAQLREQLQSFIASHALPKGLGNIYYLMTPPGVTVCVDAAATRCSDFVLSEEEEEKGRFESASYENSFCSYHAAINPDKAPEGDSNTILYAAIPWTAGYAGLRGTGFVPNGGWLSDPTAYIQGASCQDGGLNPEVGEEKLEVPKEMNKEEKEKFAEMSKEEQAGVLKRVALEAPHDEEPNQEGKAESDGYGAGLSDLIANQIAVEQANTVTDPLLNGWKDATGHEATDECRNIFAGTAGPEGGSVEGGVKADEHTEAGTLSNEELDGTRYYINNVFSLSTGECVGGVGLVPRFTSPNPVNSGEVVGFDGMESTVGLVAGKAFGPSGPPTTTYSTYSWNFGDGSPEVKGYAPGSPTCEAPWLSPCAGAIFHSYNYGGKYTVTLTVTDVAGDMSSVSHEVIVNGPPAPGAGAPGTNPGSNPGDATHTIVAPIAAAAILSRSLKNTLRKGLSVRYSVNEQVAGRFEVLVSSTVAHRLHLGGSPASGLPAGTPPEVMIARAVLVTTKAGANTIEIKFSKSVVARLRHSRKLSLLLRLFVRDAASKSPATATVLSAVTLAG